MPPPDFASVAHLVTIGLIACALFPLTVLIEAVLLWLLKWSKFVTSLLVSLAMNIAAAIILIVIVLSPLGPTLTARIVLFIAVAWTTSFLIDGTIMTFMRRQPRGKTWSTAAVANLGSVGLLALTWLIGSPSHEGTLKKSA